MSERLKVLYLAGNGRSGSTLLDVILGQVPGFFPVGEVRNVWDYGLVENRACGCGAPVRDCPTWSGILTAAFEGSETPDPAAVAGMRERFAQTKRLLPILRKGAGYAARPEVATYLETLERLYRGIARSTGARVVVDSSKWPTYAFLLGNIDSIDLYVLHLVRDPRACAFSWTRKKQAEPGRYLDRQGAAYTTGYWVTWNTAIHMLLEKRRDRYMFLRYEDFAAAPRTTVERIIEFVGEGGAPSPFVTDDTAEVSGTHAIEGNVARFVRGDLTIRADQEWRDKMPAGSRALVTAMTWPLLRKYRYPVMADRGRTP
ncbi:MAG: sulfotransferase [Gemmatimonadota bacterium]